MKNFFTVITIALSLYIPQANALLNIEVTRGMQRTTPLAVIPFFGEDKSLPITSVIASDFSNSGQFNVHMPDENMDLGHSLTQLNFDAWQKRGIENILAGYVKPLGDGRYQVSIRLFNVTKTREKTTHEALLEENYTVTPSQFRSLAHHISDIAYHQLTGVKGVFSTKIAYVAVKASVGKEPIHELLIADYDGYNPQPVLTSPEPVMSPAWSRDGRHLAYVSFENTFPAIYVVDIRTGHRKEVTSLAGVNGAPAWSPDGKTLAYVSSKTGTPKLYTVDLLSGTTKRLTDGYSIDTEPAYSPDGKKLLFTSNRGGTPQLYEYNFKKHHVQRLTYDGVFNARGSYSPDGKWIAMMHRDSHSHDFEIVAQNLDTDNTVQLTHTRMNRSPSFSPNSQLILYATETGDGESLAITAVNGKAQMRMRDDAGIQVQDPAWSV